MESSNSRASRVFDNFFVLAGNKMTESISMMWVYGSGSKMLSKKIIFKKFVANYIINFRY